jgi:UDP:flavonoid glycosyltransferase YjiC (YdhE family)
MPFLILAERLRDRGHTCIIASNAGYEELTRESGFPFVAIWDRRPRNLDIALSRDPQTAWAQVRNDMLLPAVQPTLRCIAKLTAQAPAVVLASWTAFGAQAAHRELGVKLISAYLSPHTLTMPDAVNDPGLKIGLFPHWFAPEMDVPCLGFPFHDDALIPPLPAELDRFLKDGDAPVVITPGSFMREATHFFRASLAACEMVGCRALLLTPYSGQLPALPASARHHSYINLQRLLPRAAAIIHHGGIGTAAQALRAGVPQLTAPVFFDQFDNAARLELLGAGARVDGRNANAIAAALARVVTARGAFVALANRFDGVNASDRVCALVEGEFRVISVDPGSTGALGPSS